MLPEKTITAIIIEDDEEALSLLEIYLKAFREIEVIDKTLNPKQGIKLLIKKMPDIVFLDIDMPEVNGLEVAEAIKENQLNTEIVFTTAHSKYAFKSLDLQPLDYLVKPFGPEELISVINRYKARDKKKELERSMDIFVRNNRPIAKIKLNTKSGIVFINPDEIMMIQSQINHCYIFLSNGSVELVTHMMQNILELVDSPNMVRASRSSYINLQYLRRIDRKNRLCVLTHQDIVIEEQLNRTTLSFFEKLDCYPIT
ncbi:LytR/AlgR family response regulator transcription factor [Sunxiuqinia elliptica]|uniref:Two component transcriptional regulator, LytTR family n=1 Tax=Sunxiuqinia elliptica TaxID=655355 RepID=A0A1I2KB42_9BACT|nr:LytTR family DNA-binding domain-containing protein [Sunxiuqinia elliptica]SFF63430.1 two component transcriptional regulator, LytTR family [Sunxiuqinia elliptica]